MSYQLMKIGVEGVGQGLLMHNPAGMVPASATTARAGKRIPLPKDEAIAGLYILPASVQLYGAADWFREGGLIAAKEIKDTTRRGNATMVQRFGASVFLSDPYCPLTRPGTSEPITSDEGDWEVFLKRVVVQGQGIVRARPLIRQWQCEVEFEYDNETIQPPMVAQIMQIAGKFPGVGDYRPGKKGPFGRFRVISVNGETVPRD